jgi:hypothetical protein
VPLEKIVFLEKKNLVLLIYSRKSEKGNCMFVVRVRMSVASVGTESLTPKNTFKREKVVRTRDIHDPYIHTLSKN